MKEYYSKNPLTDKQNEFVIKFNRLHREVIEYYHFSEDIIHDGGFLWEEPEFFIPILEIGKLGFSYRLPAYCNYEVSSKVYSKQSLRAAVDFLADKYFLYIPFFILSMGLTINLSPMATCSFSLPYGYSIHSIVEEINKNLAIIRAEKKLGSSMFLDADAVSQSIKACMDADFVWNISRQKA